MEKFDFKSLKLPVKAQVAGECLMQLYKQNNNQLTPELVVEAAKSPNNPLHKCFEWNNDIAAEKYRLHQARNIIASVNIVREDGDKKIEVRAFINVQNDEEGNPSINPWSKGQSYYVSVENAMQYHPLRKYTLEMAKRDLQIFKNKYKDLIEFSKLFDFIKGEKLIE